MTSPQAVELIEFTREVIADSKGNSVFSASHEIWNSVKVVFPEGYFGASRSQVPQVVWIGIELNNAPREFSDIVSPLPCRGCDSKFFVSVDAIEEFKRQYPEAKTDQEAVELYSPDICLECLDGVHRTQEHVK